MSPDPAGSPLRSCDKYRSFRRACDRCHDQRLKCSQNPASATGSCQRCTRAKTQCTFSPRRRAAKYMQNRASMRENVIQRPGKWSGSPSPTSPGSPPPTAMENPQQEQNQQNGAGSSKLDSPWSQLDSFNMLHETPQAHFHSGSEVSASEFSAAVSMDNTFIDCSPFADVSTGTSMEARLFDFQFDIDQLGVLPDCPDSMDTSSGADQGRKESGGSSMTSDSKDAFKRLDGDCTKKLSSLAVEFQRHLMLLSQHSIQVERSPDHASQQWLSTYPIGEILFFSGEFVSILEPELYPNGPEGPVLIDEKDDGCHSPSCARAGHHGHRASLNAVTFIGSDILTPVHRYPNSPDSSVAPLSNSTSKSTSSFRDTGGVDTPTALLILNCYVSMIRTYNAIFAHLHENLHSVPARSHSMDRANLALKFDELPLTDDGAIRTYTAVRLLLDALQQIEKLLDLPDDLRCVPPHNVFETSSSSGSDNEVESMNSSSRIPSRVPAPCSEEIIGSELVRAVFRQEAQVGTENGGGGLDRLRKNIEGVKGLLRQHMAL